MDIDIYLKKFEGLNLSEKAYMKLFLEGCIEFDKTKETSEINWFF